MVALTKAVLGAALWVVGVSAAGGILGGLGWWSSGAGWAAAATMAIAAWWLVRPLSDIDGADGADGADGVDQADAADDAEDAGDAGDADVASARRVHGHARGPDSHHSAGHRGGSRGSRGSRAAAGALVAVCVAFTVGAAATRSEQVVVHRDASSNLQAAVSLARTGERVVAVSAELAASGALDVPGVGVGSMAFYEVESQGRPAVQPQFVVGPAVVYGFGWWLGGSEPEVALVLPAVATGLALLGFGLLVGRMTGAWWGVAAAGLTGVLFPVVHVARATYSEPLALLTLGAGLLALTAATGRHPHAGAGVQGVSGAPTAPGESVGSGRGVAAASGSAARRAGLVAGLLIGGTGLVRVDGLREVVLLVPVLAIAAIAGERWVRSAASGLAASTGVAVAMALWLSPRYLGDIAGSLLPLVALGALAGAVSVGLLLLWHKGFRVPVPVRRRLPAALAGGVVVTGLYLAARPLWQVVRQDPNDPGARYVAGMQARQGLPVDGGRTYAEHSVTWLSWYAGPVALVAALVVLAVLVWRLTSSLGSGRLEPWAPALVVASGSTVLTLLRPGITPDHPWADRRLLVALPLVVVLVVVAAAWTWRGQRWSDVRMTLRDSGVPVFSDRAATPRVTVSSSGPGRAGRAVAVLVVAATAVPAVLATWPHRSGGVERGSLDAVRTVCSALDPGDVVLAVDSRSTREWPQVVRGMCGVEVLLLTSGVQRDPAAAGAAVAAVRDRLATLSGEGGRLVLFAADRRESLTVLGATPVEVLDIVVREDEHALDRPPTRTDPRPERVWIAAEPIGAP
ncbi:MAG: hypothetical protein ACRCSN_02040 [Dermatophilaceae bacterium]